MERELLDVREIRIVFLDGRVMLFLGLWDGVGCGVDRGVYVTVPVLGGILGSYWGSWGCDSAVSLPRLAASASLSASCWSMMSRCCCRHSSISNTMCFNHRPHFVCNAIKSSRVNSQRSAISYLEEVKGEEEEEVKDVKGKGKGKRAKKRKAAPKDTEIKAEGSAQRQDKGKGKEEKEATKKKRHRKDKAEEEGEEEEKPTKKRKGKEEGEEEKPETKDKAVLVGKLCQFATVDPLRQEAPGVCR